MTYIQLTKRSASERTDEEPGSTELKINYARPLKTENEYKIINIAIVRPILTLFHVAETETLYKINVFSG